MNRTRLLFWVLTGLVSLAMAASGVLYLIGVSQGNGAIVDNFARLGYPSVVLALLGIAKLLGAVALVVGGATGRFATVVNGPTQGLRLCCSVLLPPTWQRVTVWAR